MNICFFSFPPTQHFCESVAFLYYIVYKGKESREGLNFTKTNYRMVHSSRICREGGREKERREGEGRGRGKERREEEGRERGEGEGGG